MSLAKIFKIDSLDILLHLLVTDSENPEKPDIALALTVMGNGMYAMETRVNPAYEDGSMDVRKTIEEGLALIDDLELDDLKPWVAELLQNYLSAVRPETMSAVVFGGGGVQ